ncbi:glycosyltransferase [Erythrobacter sp. EC-HK427]|uniref:glycosyltransferase n=1 Tax=Erythrobacter sp. EC-HK427 TaxID=2038396 RepID=UPI00125F9089|nr:glycosyltransferase [Erythrobacter sp. EC-HK427]
MADRPRILHLSGDYPDPIQPEKTQAIARLLELTTGEFDHRVISLNRVSPSAREAALLASGAGAADAMIGLPTPFDRGLAFTYAAPPKGVLHQTALVRLAQGLEHQLEHRLGQHWRKDWRPDLIVGHKLTIEGIVARHLAQRLGVPFALSLQGNTDSRITAARPDLRHSFAAILREARVVFPFAPWTLRLLEDRLGARTGPSIALPCAFECDTMIAPRAGGEVLVSVFHLAGHRWKNLRGMADALSLLAKRDEEARLEIVGGGSAALAQSLAARFAKVPGLGFAGPIASADLPARLNRAAGFVLPGLRESFGMVFTEALFAGLPILYPAGRAVDGYFDDAPFALRVDPDEHHAIADGMARLLRDEARLKAALADWQSSADAQRFTRAGIGEAFARGLRQALR